MGPIDSTSGDVFEPSSVDHELCATTRTSASSAAVTMRSQSLAGSPTTMDPKPTKIGGAPSARNSFSLSSMGPPSSLGGGCEPTTQTWSPASFVRGNRLGDHIPAKGTRRSLIKDEPALEWGADADSVTSDVTAPSSITATTTSVPRVDPSAATAAIGQAATEGQNARQQLKELCEKFSADLTIAEVTDVLVPKGSFSFEFAVDGLRCGVGSARSKKEAKEQAAALALRALAREPPRDL